MPLSDLDNQIRSTFRLYTRVYKHPRATAVDLVAQKLNQVPAKVKAVLDR